MDGGDSDKFMFAIDRGGTFTDVWARCPGGKEVVLKLLSEDPRHYRDAPTEAIRRILEQETGEELPRGSPVRTERIAWIRMGTTVATNALLERRGQRCALAVTAGFRDLLHIGNQSRPNIFDLKVECPEVLYEEVVEVKERLLPVLEGTHDHPHVPQVRGSTGEALLLLQALDEAQVRADLARVAAKGITSLAVLLLHSYSYREHEQRVASIAREVGFSHVSLSSSVSAMLRAVPRGYTASSDAYLTPVIRDYLEGFKKGFERELQGVRVSFMQSDGGLTRMDKFIGSRAILSGPAGGVVGYAATSYQRLATAPPEGASSPGKDVSRDVALAPVIGFDMGGTSTDVSRYAGAFEHVFESSIAGITLQSPQLDINTVAAGGGSRLFFQSGLFVVGPESAGANPGPVCYKKGGPLAVTDANLLLGRLLPDHFPKIFGPTEDQPLDAEATAKAFEELTAQVNAFEAARGGRRLTPQQVALGFIRVANEAMCRPIRALTQAKGHDTSRHVLAVFGGAGGQHACAVARSLGMRRVVLHRYAGVLSAYGLALADTVHELQEPCAKSYVPGNFEHLRERLAALEQRCRRALQDEGFPPAAVRVEAYLHLRYSGTDCALMCAPAPAPSRSVQCNVDIREK